MGRLFKNYFVNGRNLSYNLFIVATSVLTSQHQEQNSTNKWTGRFSIKCQSDNSFQNTYKV